MIVRMTGLGDTGSKRTCNDDHYCIGPFIEQDTFAALVLEGQSRSFREYGALAAVADGLGGYQGGSTASRVVLETLSALFYGESRRGCSVQELSDAVRRYLDQASSVLRTVLEKSPDLADAGTTVAGVALTHPDALVIFHIGDSRVLRASGGFVRCLTVDHTPVGREAAVGRVDTTALADQGILSQLTRAFGAKGNTEPEVNDSLRWAVGDTFLLGTDGWHGLDRGLPQEMIEETLRQKMTLEELTKRLVGEAVIRDGRDNATLVVVELGC